MGQFAAQTVHLDLTDGLSKQVASGQDIEIYGFIVSNYSSASNRTVHIEEADGTEFMSIELDRNNAYVMDIPFIAHKGFQITPTGTFTDFSATVFHGSPGGGVIAHGETAPRYTHNNMTSDLIIASGASVKVFGMCFSNGHTSASTITIADSNDNTIGTFSLETSARLVFKNHWIADKGLKITSSESNSEVDVCIFHSNPGL